MWCGVLRGSGCVLRPRHRLDPTGGPAPGETRRACVMSCVVLPLAKLEVLPRLRPTGLLAFHGPRVARQETQVAELAPVHLVDPHERAGHGEAQRAGLPR